MTLVRLSTVGSVDDGKSTLIGRLLYDSKGIFEDQLAAVRRASHGRGNDGLDLALLTDGLRAERDRGITIDVAYRYFATPRRSFILADTPGHLEYTRNMVTGASTADVALILVDVTRGAVEQSRRHAAIAALLGVPHLIMCVNKMDLVAWRPAPFREVADRFGRFVAGLGVQSAAWLPISALHGDNVVTASKRMPWYRGPTLLERLERLPPEPGASARPMRLPIQLVIDATDATAASNGDGPHVRYAGRLESGRITTADVVRSMATGQTARVVRLAVGTSESDRAVAPLSVSLELDPPLDLRRGDLLSVAGAFDRPPAAAGFGSDVPIVAHELAANVCWMSSRPLTPGSTWLLKHTTRWVQATCIGIRDRYDVNTQERQSNVPALGLNEIGAIVLSTDAPLFVDRYRDNRATGSFIIVDQASNETVAAGMVEDAR